MFHFFYLYLIKSLIQYLLLCLSQTCQGIFAKAIHVTIKCINSKAVKLFLRKILAEYLIY